MCINASCLNVRLRKLSGSSADWEDLPRIVLDFGVVPKDMHEMTICLLKTNLNRQDLQKTFKNNCKTESNKNMTPEGAS
jgi:hypothetical protein